MSIGLPEKFELPNLANFGFDLENRELATLIYLVIIIVGVMMWGTVANGDYVVVCTRTGTPGTGKTTNDKRLHRLFWNLDHAVWNNEGDRAVLIEMSDASTFTVSAEA